MSEDQVRVGLVGLGFIGKVHANAYHAIPYCYKEPSESAKICAVLRTKTGRDLELLGTLGIPYVTADESAFYDRDLDMVDICTPNALHMDQALAALSRGLHVYVEKPLGMNLDHARVMADAARKAGVLTHTAFMMRYFPGVRQAKAIIASGVLGEIYNFRAQFFHNSYMDPGRPTSWRLQDAMSGGGALTDLGVHVIDMMRYLLGEATWVRGRTRTFIKQRPATKGSDKRVPVDVDDWALCTIGLENGAVGCLEVTRLSGGLGDTTRIEILGSRGSVVFDVDQHMHCEYYDQNTGRHHLGDLDFPAPEEEVGMEHLWPLSKMSLGHFVDAHTACIYDFLRRIRSGKPSLQDFDDAVKTQEILEAAYLSARRDSEIIQLPLD